MSQGERKRLNANNTMITINFKEIIKAILDHFWTIVFCALLCAAASLAFTIFYIQPDYQTDFTAYINNRTAQDTTQTLQSGDITAAQSLTHTYAAIMISRPVVDDALETSGLSDQGYSYDSVISGVTSSVDEKAQLVQLYVTLDDPFAAYQLCEAIAETSPQYISSIVEGSSMRIVTAPTLPLTTHSPNVKRNGAAAGLAGGILMVLLFAIRAIMDQSVKSETDLEKRYNLPVIGTISNRRDAGTSDAKYGYRRK